MQSSYLGYLVQPPSFTCLQKLTELNTEASQLLKAAALGNIAEIKRLFAKNDSLIHWFCGHTLNLGTREKPELHQRFSTDIVNDYECTIQYANFFYFA
jgi:hypothetical protein